MAYIIIPGRSLGQPISNNILPNFNYSARLTGLWNFTTLLPPNLILPYTETYPAGIITSTFSNKNKAVRITNTSIFLERNSWNSLTSSDSLTFVWSGSLLSDAGGGYGSIICKGSDSSGTGWGFQLGVGGDWKVKALYVDNPTTNAYGPSVPTLMYTYPDSWFTAVATKLGTRVFLVVNSKLGLETAEASGGNGSMRGSFVGIGLGWGGNSSDPRGTSSTEMVAVFEGALKDEEAIKIALNPWQLFKKSNSRTYFDMPTTVIPNTPVTRKPLTLNAEGGIITPTLLGSGTPASDTFLRGDGTWQTL